MRAAAKANASASAGGTPGEKGRHFSIGKGVGSGRSSAISTPRAAVTPRAKAQSAFSTPFSVKNVERSEEETQVPVKIRSEMDIDTDGEFECEGMYISPTKTEDKKVARVLFPNAMKATPAVGSGSGGIGGDGVAPTVCLVSGPEIRAGSTLGVVASPMSREPWQPRASRTRSNPMRYGMVSYEDIIGDEDNTEGCDDDVESSASDYIPDYAFGDDEFA
ncbi:hypothetical protein BJX63DRAFT_432928 [Aspergillus granulosus]|uniref:Uncharacterized protein n=1 Tax=Aspergillus granulosus TaxID=176169 RepID=A0ABR4H9P2_9EURO